MADQPREASNPGRRDLLKTIGLAAITAGSTSLPSIARESSPPHPDSHEDRSEGTADLEYLGGSPVHEGRYRNGERPLPSLKARVLALKTLLIKEKGILKEHDVEGFVQYYEKAVGPHLGAAAVAHAWRDASFRHKLLEPPAQAPFETSTTLREFLTKAINPDTGQPLLPANLIVPGTAIGPEGNYVRVLANGLQSSGPNKGRFIHNIVSCTICSCYPQALLGIQPTWYKSQQYRARVVRDPLGVLDEFMDELIAGDQAKQKEWRNYRHKIDEIQVWDSNSEVRFFVIPSMPLAWNSLSEHELRKKVTRNSMIGAEILLP